MILDSIINYSVIYDENRIDAEYFQSKFTEINNKSEKQKYIKLHELCEFIQTGPSGAMMYSSNYTSNGIKVIRPSNLNGWTCDNGNFVYVTEDYCLTKKIKLYKQGDILISRVGDLKFGIIEDNKRIAISPNMIAVRTNQEILDPYYLLAFLNTQLGFNQICRGMKNLCISSVTSSFIEKISIPLIPLSGQTKQAKIIENALRQRRKAMSLYSQAENLLMKSIKYRSKNNISNKIIVNFSLLKCAKRADAEYYFNSDYNKQDQIKTEELGDIASIRRGIEVGRKNYEETGKLFLRASNISEFGLLNKCQKFISDDLFNKLSHKYQPQVGEILLVKDGKPGTALVLHEKVDGIIAEGIVRLRLINSIPAEYIVLSINSKFCRKQIYAHLDGSLVPHWKVDQIKNLKIPLVEEEINNQIVELVKKSFWNFRKSNYFLNKLSKKFLIPSIIS